MSKPWLEKWWHDAAWESVADDNHETVVAVHPDRHSSIPFIAAAPDMCRSLLAVEWLGHVRQCGFCKAEKGPSAVPGRRPGIHEDCWVDAALTKAGLPDQASRDAARKELGL